MYEKSGYSVKDLAMIGLLSAFAVISIFVFRVPGPGGNVYFHLGEGVMITSAIFLGKRRGALIGGISGAVADILLGAALWSPFSLVIHGLKGWIIGALSDAGGGKRDLMAICAGISVMIIGYTLTAGLIYGIAVMPVEFIGDIMQGGLGAVLSFAFTKVLSKRFQLLSEKS